MPSTTGPVILLLIMNVKYVGIAIGGLFAFAHVGLLDIWQEKPDFPVIQFPKGDYSSYEVKQVRMDIRLNTEQMTNNLINL